MGGGNKKQMKEEANKHFEGLRQIVPGVKRLMLFDYDNEEDALNPKPDNMALYEGRRKNIENYLLVQEAWHRAAANDAGYDLFNQNLKQTIAEFFESENLTLPKNKDWKTVDANVFKVVDGKKILYENENSLFQKLKQMAPDLNFNKETIAGNMKESEIHEDIVRFFEKLEAIVQG
jgi:hypothetical protein